MECGSKKETKMSHTAGFSKGFSYVGYKMWFLKKISVNIYNNLLTEDQLQKLHYWTVWNQPSTSELLPRLLTSDTTAFRERPSVVPSQWAPARTYEYCWCPCHKIWQKPAENTKQLNCWCPIPCHKIWQKPAENTKQLNCWCPCHKIWQKPAENTKQLNCWCPCHKIWQKPAENTKQLNCWCPCHKIWQSLEYTKQLNCWCPCHKKIIPIIKFKKYL